MLRFLRVLRLAGIGGVGAAALFGVWELDSVLGTGRFMFGLGLGLVVGVGGFFAFIARMQRQAPKSIRLQQPPMQSEPAASYDWKVHSLDGTAVGMETTRGGTLFLNIWSTMCPPCVAELPSIERLQQAISGDAVQIMCVATDGDVARVRDFVASKGWKLPVFVLGDCEIPPVFDSDYIPATYVVSPDGRVVYQHVGAALWDHASVVSFLRGLTMRHAMASRKIEHEAPIRTGADREKV